MNQLFSKISLFALLITFLVACDEKKSSDETTSGEAQQTTDQAVAATEGTQEATQGNSEEEAIDPETAPKFEFDAIEYDFGTITAGEVVDHVFKFTNVGKSPLIIESTSATCGCTVPEHTKEPVEPGQSGEIKVVFNSSGKSGVQSKPITITANSYPKVNKVFLKGNVQSAPQGDSPVQK